ncbi:MAG: putative epimerase/dehydratase [Mucilaginibacter sp.]|uniref:NAD-dependent epimerase/dehydratase family protein n=1 Tax=Mucilaginibacter sp. TaxID=1882438 RepID=UPI002623DE65|nr:NAD-dependent epimerase/dehydratase family protein [Mucilaginibacter sp.]MDB5004418.1 putative epimerase/dehydratase [Mucilaginibacter sp.]
MKLTKILVIGACGQLGTELTVALRQKFGTEQVIAADQKPQDNTSGPYVQLDVLNFGAMADLVRKEQVTQVYLLAAILSATGEQNIHLAWELNMQGLINVLKIAAAQHLDKVFWPSSIAVFGPGSPRYNCPQNTRIEPTTMYGISKRAGESWCSYYFEKFGVDVRSLRYPGLISHAAKPGGGTTDYAIDIFHQAIQQNHYTCFLKEDTCLPMLYMEDAVRATLKLMEAPEESIKIRTSYNLAGMSFAPCDIAAAIRRHIPGFTMAYEPDHRQVIADSWPASIRDTQAREEWGWQPAYTLETMVADMLANLNPKQTVKFCDDNYVFTRLDEP